MFGCFVELGGTQAPSLTARTISLASWSYTSFKGIKADMAKPANCGSDEHGFKLNCKHKEDSTQDKG